MNTALTGDTLGIMNAYETNINVVLAIYDSEWPITIVLQCYPSADQRSLVAQGY